MQCVTKGDAVILISLNGSSIIIGPRSLLEQPTAWPSQTEEEATSGMEIEYYSDEAWSTRDFQGALLWTCDLCGHRRDIK